LAHGVNFIDTAEMYPVAPRAETVHRTESYIGTWLKNQQRDKLIVATKIAGPARGFNWIRGTPRINREHLTAAIDGSLRRLQTDYVDLYQIHWPDRYVPMFGSTSYDVSQERETVPIAEQLQVLAELIAAGKVRHIGLSNETPWGVAEFVRCAAQLGLPKIVSVQNAYHLMNRTFERPRRSLSPCKCKPARLQPAGFRLSAANTRQPTGARPHHPLPGFGQRYPRSTSRRQQGICAHRAGSRAHARNDGVRLCQNAPVHRQRHSRRDYAGAAQGESG
jgi:hypothetical protein